MKLSDIAKLETFVVEKTNHNIINVAIHLVHKDNLGDERLVKLEEIPISTLVNKPLKWYDLYFGMKKYNRIKIAPVYLNGNDLYLLEKKNKEIKVVSKNVVSVNYCDDYDNLYMISVQIYPSYREMKKSRKK